MKTIKIATLAKTATFAAVAGALTLGLASPANAASGTMYGDPTAAAKYWSLQQYDDCGIMASADVVGEVTGKKPSEQAIISKAQSTPSTVHAGSIYIKQADTKKSGMGTSAGDLPTLLAQYGIKAVISDKDDSSNTGVPAGMEGLEQLLRSGRKVIAYVNAELIWGDTVESKDKNGNPRSDHFVVVTGIDTTNGKVHLNDSGIKTGRDEQVSLDLFLKAWDTSNGYETIIVTT